MKLWLAAHPDQKVGYLFFLSWETVARHKPAKENAEMIKDDIARWDRHSVVPTYVVSYLRTE